MRSIGPRLLALLCIVIGTVALHFGMATVKTARLSNNWPTVPGRITTSAVESRTSSKGGRSYRAAIRYEYTVAEQVFSSDSVALGGFSWAGESRAQKRADRYPVGKTVTVHYDPAAPDNCVLEAGVSLGTFVLPGFGAVFLLAGFAALIQSVSRGRGN